MASASTYASNCSEPLLKLLYIFETCGNLIAPLKVEVQALRLKLAFLRAILCETGKWHVEDENLKLLLVRVQSAFTSFRRDILSETAEWQIEDEHLKLLLTSDVQPVLMHQCMDLVRVCAVPMYRMAMHGLFSSMLKRIELLGPDIQEMYTILSKYSSRSVPEMTNESVMTHLNSCLENILDLLRCKTDSVVPIREELESVQQGLRFMRNLLGFAASRCNIVKLKDLIILAEFVADNIACLLCLCCINELMDDQMISWMKLELLSQNQRIRPAQPEVRNIYMSTIKASNSASCTTMEAEFILGVLDSLRENLLELSENKLGYSVSVKEQMLALHDELRFLECLVVDSPCEEHIDLELKFRDLSKHNNILINEAAFLVFSFYDDKNKDMASEGNPLASDLLAKIKIAKEEARQIYEKFIPKFMLSNFPCTNAQGFIISLLGNLKLLLSSKDDSIAPLKHHIEPILDELLSLREYFSKTQDQPSEQELQDHWTRFKDVAYRTEYIIDSFLAKGGEVWFHKLGLFDVNEEIKTIKMGLSHVRGKMADESTALPKVSSFPSQIPLQTSPKDEFVVFEHESEKIMEQLMQESGKVHILSIVGMPGIGKTTLANSLFQHSSVTYHFHVRARCCVSQAYDRKRLLLEMLEQVTSTTLHYTDEDLDHKLSQSLRGRRYLIFLDDIWDFELLQSMRLSFPDDGNGSRIMITSRLDDIASKSGAESVTYHLSPLPDYKSWEMLQFKLFGNESCPKELEQVGKLIAMSCSGLPLTIDLIAGILRQIDVKQDSWSWLAEILLKIIVEDPQKRCWEVLEISYNHLPHHLRPCFLYFGGFPEDMRIPARRLKLIWIAEGFVQVPENENDKRSLEDIATTYLDQLISRSLIMVFVRGSLGTVKESHIHDLLHGFAIRKAIEERFLLPINFYSNFSTLSSIDHPWFEQHRLCIYPDYRERFFFSNPSGPYVRSLVFPLSPHIALPTDKRVFDWPINLSNFRILRVFDLPDIQVKNLSPSLLQLIHIRFLALKSCEPGIFSAILHRLQNLETLIITNGISSTEGRILSLKDIENMARLKFLRHFSVSCFCFPRISRRVFERREPVQLHNLQYLSSPLLFCGDDQHEMFMRLMPNLRKLKCHSPKLRHLKSSWKLDFVKNLESLTYSGASAQDHAPSIFSFPPYLKKLTLSFLYLPWTHISVLGRLEHLEVLKFRFLKSSTDTWDMVNLNQQFPKLKCLQLSLLDIKEWNAEVEDFPLLERLQVLACEGLEKLPSCLEDIPTLQEIVLVRCRSSLAISAMEIKEVQVEQGNEQIVVEVSGVIDEDHHGAGKSYYEAGLSVLDGEGEGLTPDQITLIGIGSEINRQAEMLLGIKQ